MGVHEKNEIKKKQQKKQQPNLYTKEASISSLQSKESTCKFSIGTRKNKNLKNFENYPSGGETE